MRGYAISTCKKSERKTPFGQKSRSNKEYPFLLDQDVDLGPLSGSKQIKDDQEQPFNANNNDAEQSLLRRDPHWLFKGQLNGEGRKRTAMRPATLRRNFSATSLCQRNSSSSIMFERPSSSRSNIQRAVKRAFSMKLRRSSSASSQSEYCRIIHDQDDQPFSADDHDDIDNNHGHEGDYYYHVDHQDESGSDSLRNGSNGSIMEKRSLSMKQKGSNSKSNVLKACKRLFSRKFA